MDRRAIADTGIQVSPVGFGTVKFGRNQGVKYPKHFALPDDSTALKLIHGAKDLGINLIDTAPAYGSSEERLGQLLKGQRQDWVICSKVGEEFNNDQSNYNFTPDYAKKSIQRSLERLNTEYIDIMLVHSDGNDIDNIKRHGILDYLYDVKQAGLIRSFGMSTKTVEGGILAAEKSDIVMVTLNLSEQNDTAVIDFCQQYNKGVFIKKAFASGHLDNLSAADPVQASMDLIFSHAGVTSVIVGTLNYQHLIDNVGKACKAIEKNN